MFLVLALLLLVHGNSVSNANDDRGPIRGLCRYPDLSRHEIVFIYGNDIWMVPKEGGIARPVANPSGLEGRPRFSPDGKSIAFLANYDGGLDLYTLPIDGGIPKRVTHHPAAEVLCDWSPDGKELVLCTNLGGLPIADKLYTIPASGGLPKQLPVPYGANGSIDKTGEWLAYTPHSTDQRTWKRYRGGMATDIWLYHLKTGESKKITDWEGTDTLPMWHGRTVYFLSDRGAAEDNVLNVWSYDLDTGKTEQVTSFRTHDVKWPATGPDDGGASEMVLQHGDRIYTLDLGTRVAKAVDITVPGERDSLRVSLVDAQNQILGAISPSGKRVALIARGDIWTIPAENGTPRNLTRTDGVFEKDAEWSPDGKLIAFFSDATGEYELYTMPADGKSEGAPAQPRQITKPVDGLPSVCRNSISWAPDSKSIVIQDSLGNIDLVKLSDGSTQRLDRNPIRSVDVPIAFSHDSRWIAWSRDCDATDLSAIYLYDTLESDPDKARTQVTSGFYDDTFPTFDRKGNWLVYMSQRKFTPTSSDLDSTWVYTNSKVLMAVPLMRDFKLPWLGTSDEEPVEEAKPTDKSDTKPAQGASPGTERRDDKDSEKGKSEEPKSMTIDLDGFEGRAVQLPIVSEDLSSLGFLEFNDRNELLYQRKGSIRILDLNQREPEEKTGVAGMAIEMSADGKKLLLLELATGKKSIADTSAGATAKAIYDRPMVTEIRPRAEWAQILTDAWRLYRDYFYDPGMHGVDWQAIRVRYEAMLPAVVTREDLNYILSEMISELNVGHAFLIAGGFSTEQSSSRRSIGMLGVEFAAASNDDGTPAKAWKLAKFIGGTALDSSARSPLAAQGLGVSEGDYLLAVNGEPVDPSRDPWSQFVDLAGKSVVLTVSKKPIMDNEAKDITVKALESESHLHYRAWVESNRRRVEELSDGRIGYIHVPDTGENGQNELVRQFYGQRKKPALLIDERWNSGGQFPHRFIELLNRPITNYWAHRDAPEQASPPEGHFGPKAMLINGMAGSGGDMFPWLFRHKHLGPLIGTRTWGGLVGYAGTKSLIDGDSITVPSAAFYETDGTWGVEGHGVDPDIEVIDDPAQMKDGRDPQLEKGVELLLRQLETNPNRSVPAPKRPNRSGMGIAPSDK